MKAIARVRAFFIKQEAGKEMLNQKRFWCAVFAVLVAGISFILFSNTRNDSSVVVIANKPIEAEEVIAASVPVSPKVSSLLKISAPQRQVAKPKQKARPAPKQKLKYKAPQVITRADSFSSKLPISTNIIGKLLTSIDTRESEQLYKVLLPYGGKGRHGDIPKKTILFGTITYPNKGRKVFMQFSKALLPEGEEIELKAQALNTKDYSPGLEGELHRGATARVAATIGLTMVSAFTDTLTQKQVLGNEGVVTPKSTVRDALYQGVAKASESEAHRQAAELGNVQAYVTIPAGRELIVNLLSTYRSEQ